MNCDVYCQSLPTNDASFVLRVSAMAYVTHNIYRRVEADFL